MNYQILTFDIPADSKASATVPGAYTFVPDKKLFRLSIWLWKVLTKLGCLREARVYKPDKATYQLALDTHALARKILLQQEYVVKTFGCSDFRVLMGSEDFYELVGEAERESLYMQIETEYRAGEYKDGRIRGRIFGMKIEVVPWLKGIILLPANA